MAYWVSPPDCKYGTRIPKKIRYYNQGNAFEEFVLFFSELETADLEKRKAQFFY
jgi:hypothetical protein